MQIPKEMLGGSPANKIVTLMRLQQSMPVNELKIMSIGEWLKEFRSDNLPDIAKNSASWWINRTQERVFSKDEK